MESKNIGRNTVCNPLRRLVDRVLRQMDVARRRLDVAVTVQLADHGQGLSEARAREAKDLTQVTTTHILQTIPSVHDA